jgi:hypothetical protein
MASKSIYNKETFHVFNYTENSVKKCGQSMDARPTAHTTDAESTEQCCNCLQCMFCWPAILMFDILSCPIRFCMHKKNENK